MVGRPRDGDDRVSWLIEHARFEQALHILDTDRSLKSSSHQKVSPISSAPLAPHKAHSTATVCLWIIRCAPMGPGLKPLHGQLLLLNAIGRHGLAGRHSVPGASLQGGTL